MASTSSVQVSLRSFHHDGAQGSSSFFTPCNEGIEDDVVTDAAAAAAATSLFAVPENATETCHVASAADGVAMAHRKQEVPSIATLATEPQQEAPDKGHCTASVVPPCAPAPMASLPYTVRKRIPVVVLSSATASEGDGSYTRAVSPPHTNETRVNDPSMMPPSCDNDSLLSRTGRNRTDRYHNTQLKGTTPESLLVGARTTRSHSTTDSPTTCLRSVSAFKDATDVTSSQDRKECDANNSVDTCSGSGVGVASGGLWIPHRKSSPHQRPANLAAFTSAGSVATNVSMTGVELDPAAPADLPPVSVADYAAGTPSLDEATSLIYQRNIVNEDSVIPIHLEERIPCRSFMSLSSAAMTLAGCYQAPGHSRTQSVSSCRRLFPSDVPAEPSGSANAAAVDHVDTGAQLAPAQTCEMPALAAPTLPASWVVVPTVLSGTVHRSHSRPVSRHSTQNSTKAPTPTETIPANQHGDAAFAMKRDGEKTPTNADPPLPSPLERKMSLDTYAAIQLDEFEARHALSVAEAKEWERMMEEEVSVYLWRSRCAHGKDEAAHSGSCAMARLKQQERLLFDTHIQERVARQHREHANALRSIAQLVPPQNPTTVSRLSSQNMSDMPAYGLASQQQQTPARALSQQKTLSGRAHTAGTLHPPTGETQRVDAEVARQTAVMRFLSNAGQPSGPKYFPDIAL